MTLLRGCTVLLFVSLSGCADLSQYTKQGADLVSQFGPEIGKLIDGNKAQQDRAAKVPDSTEGKSDVLSGLTQNGDLLNTLKGGLEGLPAKLDEVIKGGNVDDVTKLLSDKKASTSEGIETASKNLKDLGGKVTALEAKAAAPKAPAPVAVAAPVEPASFSKTLASGFVLKGAVNGLESQLIGFIEDAGKPVDKTTWFNFDRLTFKTGSAEVDMDKSKDQLTNIAQIMAAYPKVTFKVGGYTDNQGSAATNKKLSADRASNVAKGLGTMGVAAKRLAPEGFGPEFPVCPANDSDDCRAQNRRISLRVTAK